MTEDGPQVLLAGSLSRDRVCLGADTREAPGGTVWYAGHALAALGVRTRLVTRTATADRPVLRSLERRGAQVFWFPSRRTTTLELEYARRGGERRLRAVSLAEPVEAQHLGAALSDVDVLYLGPLHPADLHPECIALIRDRPGLRVVLDVQGLVRQLIGRRLEPRASPELDAWLSVTHVLKASISEARVLCASALREAGSLLEALAARKPVEELIITGGEDGAWIRSAGDVHHARAEAVAADPTGAGDVFLAAWLSRRIRGVPAARAADFAVRHVAAWLDAERRIT